MSNYYFEKSIKEVAKEIKKTALINPNRFINVYQKYPKSRLLIYVFNNERKPDALYSSSLKHYKWTDVGLEGQIFTLECVLANMDDIIEEIEAKKRGYYIRK